MLPFDDIRAALFALFSHPIAVASLILLAGINAAIWLMVFERIGVPTALASLLLVPPLTFLLPLCVALTRWPSDQRVWLPIRPRRLGSRPARRVARPRPLSGAVAGGFDLRRPLRLDADGLPQFRIPLVPSSEATPWTQAAPGIAGFPPQQFAPPGYRYPQA